MAEPINIYESVPSVRIGLDAAALILHAWINAALCTPLAVPAHCPNCRTLAASITVGRGEPPWLRIEPCGCLLEVTR